MSARLFVQGDLCTNPVSEPATVGEWLGDGCPVCEKSTDGVSFAYLPDRYRDYDPTTGQGSGGCESGTVYVNSCGHAWLYFPHDESYVRLEVD